MSKADFQPAGKRGVVAAGPRGTPRYASICCVGVEGCRGGPAKRSNFWGRWRVFWIGFKVGGVQMRVEAIGVFEASEGVPSLVGLVDLVVPFYKRGVRGCVGR